VRGLTDLVDEAEPVFQVPGPRQAAVVGIPNRSPVWVPRISVLRHRCSPNRESILDTRCVPVFSAKRTRWVMVSLTGVAMPRAAALRATAPFSCSISVGQFRSRSCNIEGK